ncbi:RagB/SusD family nutrient uptake outer membrane protein [Agriterribacter sp.]|uniref:RagB/SusD family nutrient uptake outer membrane protein n=1 Tax=Agriterribacter sp. TaxID=2821509 RepID=UPI002B67E231|nr:RagB/SusD family nutrient uptake outer membrane protein [Agriterribacter sp.]HRP57219.1 RagB/SusD family nutrient uptake outer membrane protein [Agriterribacter sp.]
MKKILNKKWRWLPMLLAVIIVTTASCNKNFLDRKPLGRYTDEDVAKGSFDSKVFGAYAVLRNGGFNNHEYLGVQSYRSDESEKGSSVSDGAATGLMYDDFEYNASGGGIQGYWSDHYLAINAANDIIHIIDSLGAADEPTLINKAEAKFIRAFSYFDLVRAFGSVPKIDFTGTAAELNIAKSSPSEIFTLIDTDLQEAAAVLPLDWEAKYIGRVTKGAAMALQARAYLWRSDWANALGAAKSVMALSKYSLVPKYGDQFRSTGENGPESIFEIQAFYEPTIDQGIIYSNVQGVRGAGAWDLGWGWNTPTQILVDEFEEGDPRKIETILFSGQIDPLYSENVPPFPTIPRLYWNKKIYTDPADRLALNNRFGPWMNHRILRYGDVLLMAAEAANELGGEQNTTDALGWLEEIRNRARGGNNAILPPVTTTDQAELRDAIRHERFVELGMEEQRFWDIVRWGIDVDVLHAAGKTNYAVRHRLLPIPQGEIDKSGGVLIQNPDY